MKTNAKDPVCGTTVDRSFSSRRHFIGDVEYCFCSDACMTRFLSDPTPYTKSAL